MVTEKQLRKYAKEEIAVVKVLLADPLLRAEIKSYWAGQWDGIQRLCSSFGVKVEQRP